MPNKQREPIKYCRHCGQRLRRRRFPGGQLERPQVFKKRKYCNRVCWAMYSRPKQDS